jgi:hypothetical protein
MYENAHLYRLIKIIACAHSILKDVRLFEDCERLVNFA